MARRLRGLSDRSLLGGGELWRESRDLPGRSGARVLNAIVEPMASALPKLDGVRNHAVSAPRTRKRHPAIGKLFAHLGELRFEDLPR